ncbi:MAG: recombinase family protein, partial [Eubacterium sp.]|nr:recombinase family protein [Eubacterium sp.]
MKAVIYARYSSDNQREESIEGQIRECTSFAERKGYTIVKSYVDRAMSGKRADNRPEFQQMISDSAKGEFDVVIVWKIDRFSRDKYDSVIYKAKLIKNGVIVISATEPIDDSPEGKLMESIFEGFAEYFLKDLEMKTSRGMTENAIKGKFNGGTVTFGYQIDSNGHFQKHPINAVIVTEIFIRYASGETIRNIIDNLSERGIRNRNKKLSYHFINGLLKNRRYIGEYKFRDTVNMNAIPPLITPEIFNKCQQILEDNKHKPASFKVVDDKYFLTGKIFCGKCGDTMSGVSGTSKDKNRDLYRYYQCMTSKKKNCQKKMIRKKFIEDTVLKATMKIFDDTALIKRITDSCYSLQTNKGTQLSVLKKQLKQKQKEINNIMTAIKAGIFTKSTKTELEKLESEQEEIQLLIAKEQIERPIISKEKIESFIMDFSKTDINNDKQKQRLIDVFINSIRVYDDKLVILFNYRDGEKCITFDELSDIAKKENTHKCECSSFVNSG